MITTQAKRRFVNFIKDKTLRQSAAHKRDVEDMYTSDNHSLLPYLYMYPFGGKEANIGYVLVEPRTRSLIAVDIGDYEASKKVIGELERQNKSQLTHILTTHHHSDHSAGNDQWKIERPGV